MFDGKGSRIQGRVYHQLFIRCIIKLDLIKIKYLKKTTHYNYPFSFLSVSTFSFWQDNHLFLELLLPLSSSSSQRNNHLLLYPFLLHLFLLVEKINFFCPVCAFHHFTDNLLNLSKHAETLHIKKMS